MRLIPILIPFLLALALAESAFGHGGVYRGPGQNGPGTGGPGQPGVPTGPITGRGSTSSTDSWSQWWEFHKDRYLRVREAVIEANEVTDPNTGDVVVAGGIPLDQIRDEVLPALDRLIRSSEARDVQTAVMMAFAKIGVEHPEIDVVEHMRGNLKRGNQEVREAAALALGVSGLSGAYADLVAVAMDGPNGRKLVGGDDVDERTRAFAVYGIGLHARRVGTESAIAGAIDQIGAVLGRIDFESRHLATACVHALGLLVPDTSTSAGKRLAWRALKLLDDAALAEMSRGDEVVRAHVYAGAAHLLGRGVSDDHQRWKERMVRTLDPRRDDHYFVRQAAVLALGELCLPGEDQPSEELFSEKLREVAVKEKDQMAQRFALVALARITGDENRNFLLRRHRVGKKGTDKPWAAIALGVHAKETEIRGLPASPLLPAALLKGFDDAKSDEYRSACAVALGLCKAKNSEKRILVALEKSDRRDFAAGYYGLSLALIGEPRGLSRVREQLLAAEHRPLQLVQAAVGLAVARDPAGLRSLEKMLTEKANTVAELAALANAFRFVGDRGSVGPLIRRVDSKEGTTLARAFAAAALGGICDPRPLPWNAPISEGTNYLASVTSLIDGLRGILDIL